MTPPPLAFGASEMRAAFEAHGANCGPGAIAALTGVTPCDVLGVMPDFARRRITTEGMLCRAVAALGGRAAPVAPDAMCLGALRIAWEGPWWQAGTPASLLSRTHWIAVARPAPLAPRICARGVAPGDRVFDFNAIGVGGWISGAEWRADLVPWLLARAVPGATGRWIALDAYAVVAPAASRCRMRPGPRPGSGR